MTTPVTPDLPPLFSSSSTVEMTFDFPSILQDAKTDAGADVFTVMNGGRRQVQMTSEVYESETAVESPPIFKIIAPNRIGFGGAVLTVLNDPVTYGGSLLAPSNPTASAYLALRGQKVFNFFSCVPVDKDSMVFRTRKRANLFVVRQSSFILP